MGIPEITPMSRLQRVCHCLAIVDIIFYFCTIVASVAVENSVSDMRPMRFQFAENGTVSVTFAPKNELMAIWDYLYSQHYTSSTLYNAVYMSLVVIAVTYLIVEVWLCCVLIRGATERSLAHCKQWFWWRVALMLLTATVAGVELAVHLQTTFTLLIFIPLNIFRMSLLALVLQLIRQYQREKLSSYFS